MISDAPEPRGVEISQYIQRLRFADWYSESDSEPMRFSSNLTLADLGNADFFQNARLLLAEMEKSRGTPTTATGNLNRAFVRHMSGKVVLPELYRKIALPHFKVLNETDVWPLHIARIVSELAGLLTRRKKRFQITRKGCEMLADDQAGVLYRELFLSHFRKLDLRYRGALRDVPGIQETMAVVLWRLDNIAQNWAPVKDLASQTLLPKVLEQLQTAMKSPYEKEEWIFGGYVLNPLVQLGLIEDSRTPGDFGLDERDQIRITPLWRKFIRFDFEVWNPPSFRQPLS